MEKRETSAVLGQVGSRGAHALVSEIDAKFVDTGGCIRVMSWIQAAEEQVLEECPPVREFAVRPGRRIAPGWWWSATTGGLVHYGFGAMRTQVILLDHDPSVVALACSPVELSWVGRGGHEVRHVPHLMARLRDGSAVLVDCAGRDGISRRLASRGRVAEAAAQSVGWHYRVVGAPDPVVAANVRWLAGYRHPRHSSLLAAEAVEGAFARSRPLVEGVRELGEAMTAWPAVFHALWHGQLSAPLRTPLHERTIAVAAGVGAPA
ncbi:TnsA-like heteromeric transposase endonuclease subunit [Streptomyces sp. NPDC020983]|uniref:TnsA-like heteromeric transposase endonuclease subunit n=1 Tax=Streptomyces sp. NPDC020983 TaxID=3365106 RepID=UPI00379F443B